MHRIVCSRIRSSRGLSPASSRRFPGSRHPALRALTVGPWKPSGPCSGEVTTSCSLDMDDGGCVPYRSGGSGWVEESTRKMQPPPQCSFRNYLIRKNRRPSVRICGLSYWGGVFVLISARRLNCSLGRAGTLPLSLWKSDFHSVNMQICSDQDLRITNYIIYIIAAWIKGWFLKMN